MCVCVCAYKCKLCNVYWRQIEPTILFCSTYGFQPSLQLLVGEERVGGRYCTFGQTKAKAMKAKVKMLCRKSWLGGSRSHCRMVTYENGKQFDLQCGWRWLALCVNAGMQVCVNVCVLVCMCDHQFWLPPSTVAMPIRGINNAKCQITSKGSVGQGNRSRRKKKELEKASGAAAAVVI